MSDASMRNFAAAVRERERRLNAELSGEAPIGSLAWSSTSGQPGWDAFWGSLHDQQDAANAAGLNFRADLGGIGRYATSGGDEDVMGGLNPFERQSLKRQALNQMSDAAGQQARAQNATNKAYADQQERQRLADMDAAYQKHVNASMQAPLIDKPIVTQEGNKTTFRPAGTPTDQILARMPPEARAGYQLQLDKQALEAQKAADAAEVARAAAGLGPSEEFTAEPPDPKKANIVNPRTGRTPAALWQDALSYATQGKLPALGLSSKGIGANAKAAIQNKAGAIAQAAGVDLPTVQQEYKALSAAENKLLPQYKTLSAYSDTANQNLQLALDQSAKVPRTGSPIVNRFEQWALGHTLTGDPELTRLETYIYAAAREYAKVTSGSFMSAAELSQGAAKKADELLNAAQTPEAFQAATQAMQNDMNNVTGPWLKQLSAGGGSSLARFLATAHGQSVPDVGAPSSSNDRGGGNAGPQANSRFTTPVEGAKKGIPGIQGGLAEYRQGRWVRVQ